MIESIAGPITAIITNIVISSNNIRAAHINLFANACLLVADNDQLLPVTRLTTIAMLILLL